MTRNKKILIGVGVVIALGGIASFDELLVAGPTAGEDGLDWPADEPTRFGRLARRLWDGLLAVEQRANL